jgi:hypothetical protein
VIAAAAKSMPAFDLLSKKRVRSAFSSTSLLQLAAVEQLPRAMNEVWNLGPQTPSGGWRAIRVDMPAA